MFGIIFGAAGMLLICYTVQAVLARLIKTFILDIILALELHFFVYW